MDITLNKNFKIIKVKPHTEKEEDEDEEFSDFINPDKSKKLKIY